MLAEIREYLRSPEGYFRPRELRLERIQQIFARNSLKTTLTDGFLEGLQKRRDESQQRSNKLLVVELTILGILLLCLIPVKVNVSFLGIQTSELTNLRELLLVVYSSLNFQRFQARAETVFNGEILFSALKVKSSGDEELMYILRHRFGLGTFPSSKIFRPFPDMFVGMGYTAMRILLLVSNRLVMIFFGMMFLTVEFWAMFDIYQKPSFDVRVSIAAIGYVLIVTAAEFLWEILATHKFSYRGREFKIGRLGRM